MNEKRSQGHKPQAMIPILLVGLAVGLGVGIFVGRQGGSPAPEPAGGGAGSAQQTPIDPGPTAQEVAEEKGVPAVLKDPGGDYGLVAVVEGPEANRKLAENLQIIGLQRQRLLVLARQLDALPADAQAQRALLNEQVQQVRASLKQNLGYMAKTYGYSLQFNYRLVAHAATLLRGTTGEDGTTTTAVVHEFKDATSYENFQALREDYLLQTVAEAKEQHAAAVEADEDRPFEPSAGLQAMAGDLKALYDYDPTTDYQIDIEKSALYARPGRKPGDGTE